MFYSWLVYRFMTAGKRFLSLPSMMSLAGMTIGVACLVVAMAVVSGFETTLKRSVIDVTGHIMLIKRGDRDASVEEISRQVRQHTDDVVAITPFADLEAVLAHGGRISGIRLQGVEPQTVDNVLSLRSRILHGEFSFKSQDGVPAAMIGKGLAKKFNLAIGDEFKVVLPSTTPGNTSDFAPRVQTYTVRGVLDLGKHEYDERVVVTSLRSAQKLGQLGDRFSGIRVRLGSDDQARPVSRDLSAKLGAGWFIMDWMEVNKNLFEAIKLERVAIFFILLIMVVAASFNIASTLFVSVLQRYADISILRAMGARKIDVVRIFTLQGLFIGMTGAVAGLVLGLLLCGAFIVAQSLWPILPAEVYKLDHIGVEVRFFDVAAILLAAFLICLLSTISPAIKGAMLKPVEGLRYE